MSAPSTRALGLAATAAYAANCALGTAVEKGVVDTSRDRRPHHALYVVTATLTVAAVFAGLVRRSPVGLVLAPALLPLAVLPFVGHEDHVGTALAAAPWYVGSLLVRAA